GIENLAGKNVPAERIRVDGGANFDQLIAGGGNHLAEITDSVSRRGNRYGGVIHHLLFAILLEIPEEEGLVGAVVDLRNPNRAAQAPSVVVAPGFVEQSGIRLSRVIVFV